MNLPVHYGLAHLYVGKGVTQRDHPPNSLTVLLHLKRLLSLLSPPFLLLPCLATSLHLLHHGSQLFLPFDLFRLLPLLFLPPSCLSFLGLLSFFIHLFPLFLLSGLSLSFLLLFLLFFPSIFLLLLRFPFLFSFLLFLLCLLLLPYKFYKFLFLSRTQSSFFFILPSIAFFRCLFFPHTLQCRNFLSRSNIVPILGRMCDGELGVVQS